jgi:hypothetical protein
LRFPFRLHLHDTDESGSERPFRTVENRSALRALGLRPTPHCGERR